MDILNAVLDLPVAVSERCADWYDIVLDRNANRCWDRRIEPQGLANNQVQIRKRIELLHRRCIIIESKQLFAKLLLDTRVLGQGEETPSRCRAGGLVASNKESRNLYGSFQAISRTVRRTSRFWIRTGQDIFVRQSLALRNVRCHVRFEEEREKISASEVPALNSIKRFLLLALLGAFARDRRLLFLNELHTDTLHHCLRLFNSPRLFVMLKQTVVSVKQGPSSPQKYSQ